MDTSLLLARLLMGIALRHLGFWQIARRRPIAPMLAQLGTCRHHGAGLHGPSARRPAGWRSCWAGLRTTAVLLGLWCILTGYLEHRANMMEPTMKGGSPWADGYFALAVAGERHGLAPCSAARRIPGILGWLP